VAAAISGDPSLIKKLEEEVRQTAPITGSMDVRKIADKLNIADLDSGLLDYLSCIKSLVPVVRMLVYFLPDPIEAQKVAVALEDALDGSPADETVRFGLGGMDYEIDLSKKNAVAFRNKLAPFIEHARKPGRGQRRRPGRTASSRERSDDIRAWAKDQGIAVSDRGRLPGHVVEQYEAVGKGS
jgi:hypothetical protein